MLGANIEWKNKTISAEVTLPGLATLMFSKHGKEGWCANGMALDGAAEGNAILYFSEPQNFLSPEMPGCTLSDYLDAILDATEFDSDICECPGQKCETLREHAERVVAADLRETADRLRRSDHSQ